MSKLISLQIIDTEISRLNRASELSGLTFEDVKKLEILVKARNLLLGEPTEITVTKDTTHLSDDDIILSLSGPKAKEKKDN